jgi:hypothetical protein
MNGKIMAKLETLPLFHFKKNETVFLGLNFFQPSRPHPLTLYPSYQVHK